MRVPLTIDLAPGIPKRLVNKRAPPAVAMLALSDCAALPWQEQVAMAFGVDAAK